MISNLVVFSSLLLAAWFTLQYIFKPGLRERVEQPKYAFLEQLSRYDRQMGFVERYSGEKLQPRSEAQIKSELLAKTSSGETE